MKSYARFSAVAAQCVGAIGILHVLLIPPTTIAKIAAPPATPVPWTPPAWFPTSSSSALWVLPDLDGGDVEESGPRLRARAAIVADLDTGEVLWSHRADERLPVASLTKTVSALALASVQTDLERTLDGELCVTPEQWPTRSGARSRFVTGACHAGWDFLGAALVKSDNRGAMGLATLSGLEYAGFVDRMVDVSRQLGMAHATWADPAGLEDDNLASARDMLKAIVAVSAHPTLSTVASAPQWTLERERGPIALGTTNKLIGVWETLAAKTGYTDTARYCFSQVVRTPSGRTLGTVVLGAPTSSARFRDTRALVEWAEAH